jgi:hypothetical protein
MQCKKETLKNDESYVKKSAYFFTYCSLVFNRICLFFLQFLIAKEFFMNKNTTAAAAALLISAAAFADGFSVNGYVRAGLSSTFESTPALSTAKWYSGTYFSGDSTGTRGRINIAWDGKNDTGNSYGAFCRLQADGSVESWTTTTTGIKYADAYTGLFGNMVTVAAGKIKDNWIATSGFKGFSVLDGKSGAAVILTPLAGLNLVGGAVIDYASSMNGNTFLGGVRYKNDMVNVSAAFAGYGLFTGNLAYTGTKNLLVVIETTFDTDHGLNDILKDQRMFSTEQVQYTGVENWTFGVYAREWLNKVKISGDNDFTLALTPAAAYQLNSIVKLSAEGTYNMPVYDNAKAAYMTIVPAVTLSADKAASVYIWGSVSTDQNQEPSCAGIGVKRDF